MTTQQNNTMAEGMSKIIKDIAQMKVEPDADMPFLISLETDILNYLKPPVPSQPGGAGGAGQPPPQQQPGPPGGAMGAAMGQVMGGGMPSGGGGGMPPGAAMAMMPGGGSGIMAGPGPGMPNPDEFRRGLGTAAVRGASRQLVHRMLNLNPAT